jgi:DNA-binding CsgD family transcriptional regulator
MGLLGRRAECQVLDRLLSDVAAGHSGVLVLRGEAGIGKSALLDYVVDRAQAQGSHLARAVGVESEMELAYNGLHQLCAAMLDHHLERLPPPQRTALATVFGLSGGPRPDRFLIGLATLTLFAEVADQEPLVCTVEDAHWLDQGSAQILAFVARRLLAEHVAIVCAARTGIGDNVLAGLPELVVGGLSDRDALALLLENLNGPLDAAVSQRIVAESHGNPLALLELPRTWSVAELAGGFGLPEDVPVRGRIEHSYLRRLHELPTDTQLLVLAAAAEPVGDPLLLHRAAARLDIDMAAAQAAADAGLLTIRAQAEFAHPLIRSSAYRSAAAHDRHRVHRALAEATDAETDPDRRAWHRACASPGPDEEVAAELECSAGRAQARGGIAAAAAFLQRAVELTEVPARRAERALAAAQASFEAGAFDATLALLATAESASVDGFQRAQAALLRGHVAVVSSYGSQAAHLLLEAAKQLGAYDLDLTRKAYLTAWGAAISAGRLDEPDVLIEICRAVRALPPLTPDAHPLHVVLDGLTLLTTDGRVAATPVLQRAAKLVGQMSVEDVLRWGWLAPAASKATWDWDGFTAQDERQAQIVRDAGALAELPIHLQTLAQDKAWRGDFPGAAALIAEADRVAGATGTALPPFAALWLWSRQGREAETTALIDVTVEAARGGGPWIGAMSALWSAAVLYNGLARYEEALAAARHVSASAIDPWHSMYVLPELVESAARVGERELARDALERLAETTRPAGNDFGLGLEARCRALVGDGVAAEQLYREATARLGRAGVRTELARSHLVYGEWLRRQGRRVDAREQLRAAHDLFVAIGMDAFAARARGELMATGEKVRKRGPDTRNELTPQEEQIARLARDGLSNPEIGAQLFISAKTVEWHLGKVFTKLGIRSRRQLRTSLPKESVPAGRP